MNRPSLLRLLLLLLLILRLLLLLFLLLLRSCEHRVLLHLVVARREANRMDQNRGRE